MPSGELPRWLYESDLPDEELQAQYVREAAAAVQRLEAERRKLAAELGHAKQRLAQAKAFLAEAQDALARYRAGARAGTSTGSGRVPLGRVHTPPLLRAQVVEVHQPSAPRRLPAPRPKP
jgi:hypothetical protein